MLSGHIRDRQLAAEESLLSRHLLSLAKRRRYTRRNVTTTGSSWPNSEVRRWAEFGQILPRGELPSTHSFHLPFVGGCPLRTANRTLADAAGPAAHRLRFDACVS